MATIKNFEDVVAWQKARMLDAEVFNMINSSKKASSDFSLKDQMLRSSGSIMDNIAEGFERQGKREFIQFFQLQRLHVANSDHNYTEHLIDNILPMKHLTRFRIYV